MKIVLFALLNLHLSNIAANEFLTASQNLTDICVICLCENPVVDCRDRGLTTSNYSWPTWKNSQVYLDYNFFVTLDVFPAINASNLSVSENRIRTIENKTFENLPFLVQLNLRNNYLTDLHPEIFSGQYWPGHYRPIILLRILDLSHNAITFLHPDLFVHLPNLEILNLSNNPIQIIGDNTRMALSKIPFIKVLDLSRTKIGFLPQYFLHNAKYLRTLKLGGNNFTRYPQEFIDDGHDFVFVQLEKNPIFLSPQNETA